MKMPTCRNAGMPREEGDDWMRKCWDAGKLGCAGNRGTTGMGASRYRETDFCRKLP